MRSFVKLPLYLGVAVLVFSVLISVIKLGNQQAFTSQRSRANVAGATLILKYTTPNLVSVLLTSDREIKGVDVTLKFGNDKITVLPSTLTAGTDFVTSGGNVNSGKSLFTFSAITPKSGVTAAVVATFTVSSKTGGEANADLQFVEKETTVIDKATGSNILNQTQGVKFTLGNP